MPAPLAKGLIIAASVIVAAGIAIYESPQVRQWVDQSRRKIAVALRDLSDDIQPRRASESSDDFDARKKRREDLVRQNRNEFIRRAREEGIAVDLDELAKIGAEDIEMAQRRSTADRTQSFDNMVGSDGMLKTNATTTSKDTSGNGLRKRGAAGFAAGSTAGLAMANPFDDDAVLFDHNFNDNESPSPKPSPSIEPPTRESSATLDSSTPLIDLAPTSDPTHSSTHAPAPLDASAPDQSFCSFTSSHAEHDTADTTSEPDYISTGTLTPRSESDPPVDDISILSMQNSTHTDADADDTRSEVFTDGGFTDAGFSDAGHSGRAGAMTPASWTDVGSDDGSEWGAHASHA